MSEDRVLSHLLACVGEECGEVQQVVGKSLRFGIHDYHPKTGEENWLRLTEEVGDLLAVYEMLANHLGFSGELDKAHIRQKKKKVVKHMKAYGDLK